MRDENHLHHQVMDNQEVKALLKKYQDGNCTEQEKAMLESWLIAQKSNHAPHGLSDFELDKDLGDVWTNLNETFLQKTHRFSWPRLAVAASIMLFLSLAGYFVARFTRPVTPVVAESRDISPGSNKAVLTLSDGKQIALTESSNGQLATQGSATIRKTDDGQVAYEKTTSGDSDLLYNTLSTPRGGQFQVTLADGTKIWLNAASSLRYPASFTGKSRVVELTGEAYFEVAHDKTKPFQVITSNQTVTVLGTHFNIDTYNDQQVAKTTLLEGSVQVNHAGSTAIIQPGQQAIVSEAKINVISADAEEATAWKNGMFQFSDENLGSIMQKVSRWYDVDIEYTDNTVKDLPLTGIITRFSNVSKVLRMLELTRQVHFKIDGKKILVIKNEDPTTAHKPKPSPMK